MSDYSMPSHGEGDSLPGLSDYGGGDTVVDFARAREADDSVKLVPTRAAAVADTVDRVDQLILARRGARMASGADPAACDVPPTFAMTVSESPSVCWMSRSLDCRVPAGLHGMDLLVPLLELAAWRGYSLYFLAPTWQSAQALHAQAERTHPDLRVAGWQEGYWREGDTPRIIAEVRETRPDMVFVGARRARNDSWLVENFHDLQVPFACGVGRAFDIYSGRLRPAPQWAEKVGVGDTWVAVRDSGRALGANVAGRLRQMGAREPAGPPAGATLDRRSMDLPRS